MCFKAGFVHFAELLVFLQEIHKIILGILSIDTTIWVSLQRRRRGCALWEKGHEPALWGSWVPNHLP